MTATTTSPRRQNAPLDERSSNLAGTAILVRFMLRRDRVKLPAWTGGLGLFVVYLVAALPSIAETEGDLAATTQLFADPVGRLLIGPGYGFDAPTYARFVANGYGLYFLILSALMSILLVVRHTRVEEQTGRAELVRANVVGPRAPLTAALIVAVITNLVATGVVFAAMVGVGGFAAGGSLLFAVGIGVLGLAFAGLTTITVQLSEYSRAAAGMAGAALGAAFLLRAGGDMAREGGTLLSWLSPLGWVQQSAPFVLDRWWPLTLALAFAVVTGAAGYTLSTRRDLGASRFTVRAGSTTASAALGTPLGLALRLQRASTIGWGAALVVTGLAYGAYADALLVAVDDMPDVFLELFGAEDLLAGYLGYMAVFMALLASAYAVMAVGSLRSEEADGRAEPVLATPVSRWTWLGANLAVTAGGVVVIMVLAGVATGLGAAMVTGDWQHVRELVLAHLNQVPAVLVVLGLAAALFGVLPRAVPATWALVGFSFFVGNFGAMLDLPQAVHNLSPFEHPAGIPLETFAALPVILLTVTALAAVAAGLVAFRRRDVQAS